MRRPPPSVVFVARTHGLVGAASATAIGLVYLFTRNLPVTFSSHAYAITAGLAALYLFTSASVWLGLPGGQVLSRVCGLLYLARPRFGSPLWEAMNAPDYRAHFARPRS